MTPDIEWADADEVEPGKLAAHVFRPDGFPPFLGDEGSREEVSLEQRDGLPLLVRAVGPDLVGIAETGPACDDAGAWRACASLSAARAWVSGDAVASRASSCKG